MADTENRIARANIENLVNLWRTMGTLSASGEDAFALRNLNWPRRCWFEPGTRPLAPDQVAAVLARVPAGYIVPVWESPFEMDLRRALHIRGYRPAFMQTAMCLDLSRYPVREGKAAALTNGMQVELRNVCTAGDVSTWCDIGGAAFGYHIDTEAVSGALGAPGLDAYLALVEGQPAATALLFRTGDIIGVHQVGVSRAFRGRGVARALMHLLLRHSREGGAAWATLQASEEGEPLYRSMNFDAQFGISNFVSPE